MENKTINRTELLMKITVGDVMHKDVITIDFDDLVAKASRLMMEHRLHSLLVLKYGKPAYMLSTYDLLKLSYENAFNESNIDMLKTQVEELVKGQKLITVRTETPLLEALQTLVEYNIHSLPVIDDNVVMGLLTLMDLARWYKSTHE
ncbi:MAG: CBS domain-containing protein [Leptospiraceae bacterium]|nr:CBS domain-containing protein [Leptospiraceae bacterium]